MTREQKIRAVYVSVDYVSTLAGLVAFSIARYHVVPGLSERFPSIAIFLLSHGVVMTLAICPLFMMFVYYLSGYYVRTEGKSRVSEFLKTVSSVAVTALVFFLVVLLNDILPRRVYNYEMIFMFFVVVLPFVYFPRLWLTTVLKRRLEKAPRPGYLLVTSTCRLRQEIDECLRQGEEYGFRLVGISNFASNNDDGEDSEYDIVTPGDIEGYIKSHGIKGVVLRPWNMEPGLVMELLSRLFPFSVPGMVSPDDKAIATGIVKFDVVSAEPLTDLTDAQLPDSFVAVKRMADIVFSALGLILCSPLMLYLAIVIRLQSPGPVIYSQVRVGYRKRPFRIFKFRSMVVDSEPDGPRLSSDTDMRVTPAGRWMRKYRLDELPNLWNVLRGEMSLVGPRPEREYFINEISKIAPHYTLLHLVRPGLTSWGMVKYGYASDVPSMVERLKYDILYVRNLSLSVDLRILFYTVRTVLRGEGK